MSILICGVGSDEPVAMLLKALSDKGIDCLFLEQEELASSVQLRWQLSDHGLRGHLRVGDRALNVHEIRSVYHRFLDLGEPPGARQEPRSLQKTRSIIFALMQLFELLPAKIVNPRRPMMSNNSKPYQGLLVRQAGFSIPDTLITNRPASLLAFSDESGPLVYKSISSIRSITAVFDSNCQNKLSSLRALPTQFQKKIRGFNIRVHVIGERVFATKIATAATDYRYASKEGFAATFSTISLDSLLEDKCIQLAKSFNLAFAGIDLMVDENTGEVFCLEVNPAPGYSYYQSATGQPIAEALADYLISGSTA